MHLSVYDLGKEIKVTKNNNLIIIMTVYKYNLKFKQ